jgi:hypothetical protein
MNKFLVATVAAAVTSPLALLSSPAAADPGTPGCVTRAEYGQVRKGMTKSAVDAELGTRGTRQSGATSGGYRSEVWSYKPCTRYSAVSIAFSANPGASLRLSAKSAVWSY